jgi:hypothetical protein
VTDARVGTRRSSKDEISSNLCVTLDICVSRYSILDYQYNTHRHCECIGVPARSSCINISTWVDTRSKTLEFAAEIHIPTSSTRWIFLVDTSDFHFPTCILITSVFVLVILELYGFKMNRTYACTYRFELPSPMQPNASTRLASRTERLTESIVGSWRNSNSTSSRPRDLALRPDSERIRTRHHSV